MIPAALASQLERGLADFLRMSFWSSTPGMERVIDRLIDTPGGLLKGPFVSVGLPFERGGEAEFFPEVPLGFPAHRHQEQAFRRLVDATPRSTLIATGTGSGKTESFLWPILEHCRRTVGTPGIKAILIYPMNALATDQAGRIARVIHDNPRLRGAVRAGLYIGETPGEKKGAHKTMGADHVVTDRKAMQLDPPDILLTNYKMLDYLLIRPRDQSLWQHNHGEPLRFLVVDELHTFDGAQGTDLACLVRRLKSRLGVEPGQLRCVGTSATLGDPDATETLRAYAEDIFGEPFDARAVIGEVRMSHAAFVGERLSMYYATPDPTARDTLDPSTHASPDAYVRAQQALWFDEPIEHPPGSAEWRVALGEQLLHHATFQNLLKLVERGPAPLDDLVASLGRPTKALRDDPALARLMVVSMLSMISEARAWMPERDAARDAREAAGLPRRTRPFLEVRLQLWQRELARMVADVAPEPRLTYSDDNGEAQNERALPMIHCRDCGAMGWATLVERDKPDLYRTGLRRFYAAFFGNDSQVRFLWPAAAAPTDGAWRGALRIHLDRETLVRVRDDAPDPDRTVPIVISDSVITTGGKPRLDRDCPFCAARGSLTLIGFRAATLTSIYIDQLFASSFNDDKKLLTFSDSVQDAAHRAGFFGARTWRFNLRVALHKTLEDAEGVSLEELPDRFVARWRGPHALSDVRYVATFLAANMEWFHDYARLRETGALPPDSTLLRDVDRRVAFEIFTEMGHQSRVGRSLARTGCATVAVDPARLDAATDALLEPLQNEVGGLHSLSRPALRAFLLGALHHLRERGGLRHRELPDAFVLSGGRDTYVFKRRHHLPSFGRTSRMPALLTDDARSPHFDALTHRAGAGSWYERWVTRCFAPAATLIGAPIDVWSVVLPALVRHDLLDQADAEHGRVWGLRPAALRVTRRTVRLRCAACAHWLVVAADEAPAFAEVPCLTARCGGTYAPDDETVDYFGRLYANGEVARVFAAEHTGLLSRGEREAVEQAFKTPREQRQPWHANLLSCTPTLEMGIDIGALSSAILCSVPPSQANYLQRIGRAGRRDGNSLLVTIAQAKPHDLYFYERPGEMIAGEVVPPGVFLDASAVLERQLAAFCLDRWNAEGVSPDAIPRRLSKVFDHLDDDGPARFPHNWLEFVRPRAEALLTAFIDLFGDRIRDEARAHLRSYLLGGRDDEGSLRWKVLDLLLGERRQRDSLRKQARKAKAEHDRLAAAVARDRDHDDQVAERRREWEGLERLVKQIDATAVLHFLTDHGLLPNYAFPESPVRLRSTIWRRRAHVAKGAKGAYENLSYEYTRPAMAALSELAPDNRFYAGGRHVTIDQVDVGTARIETWRFCDQCNHSARIDVGDPLKSCPSCGSAVWGEESQKGQLLRLEQVFARASDRDSRIRDDQEDRQPRFYNRHMLMDFKAEDSGGAWRLGTENVPFAFEFLRRARFREINFGEPSESGSKASIAGHEAVRRGFVICRHCGKVQPKPPVSTRAPPKAPEHALWCPARKRDPAGEDFETAVYLYREFHSEAIRMLLPLSDAGSDRQLHSFMAAFQLGLRDRYGGRVDHLHTLVYSEPEGDGMLRRQYLALYDTVPGGTGYLKDFTRGPAESDGPHPLLDVLRRALDRLTGCVCNTGVEDRPDADGCYRCLFAYRNSREMKSTSRRAAIELLERILRHADTLQPVDRLSDVSVSGLMDSVLEARFVEALRQLGSPERRVQVEKDIVGGKSGFVVSVGDRRWRLELQRDLGPAHGVHPPVSIDFVAEPLTAERDGRPIAVFLDGLAYHSDRVGHDLHQRMGLLAAGYDVWSFTWQDVDKVFHRDVAPAPLLVHPDLTTLKTWLGRLGLPAVAGLFERRILDVFVDVLADPCALSWDDVACGVVFAQLDPPGAVDLDAWRDEVRAHAPADAWPFFDGVGPEWLLARRPPTPERGFGLWAAAPPEALRGGFDPEGFRVLVWLDDHPERRDAPAFRDAWRGLLHAVQVLRALPHAWFVTAQSVRDGDFGSLAQRRDRPAARDEAPSAWADLDVMPSFTALVERLAALDLPRPEVGLDLPDARGHTAGVEGELAWSAARVAIVEDAGVAERPVAPDWTVFERGALTDDLQPLLAALRSGER